ncbi:MAG TPA: hypothetical protein VGX68_29290 [Thermoanaerobaculia bacterium]|jgi:hypothetical protein|nr:hypothetical protein [Thermoanaerobaculia bacterium]
MEAIQQRLDVHRMDTAILLQSAAETAKLHPSVGLADAVSHLARAHALLARELDLLAELMDTKEERH